MSWGHMPISKETSSVDLRIAASTLKSRAPVQGQQPPAQQPPASQPPVQGQPPANQPPAQQPPAQQPPAQQPPPQQQPPADLVQVQTFWQDPFVGPTETSSVPREMVGTELANPRVEINDNRPKIKPDQAGNFRAEAGSDGESQINAQVVTTRTLNMWERYRGGDVNWSFWGGGALEVIPHKKPGMNAYYSRWEGSTNYFYQPSAELNTVVKTANSTDVVAHETGHAVLDGMKPGYLSTNDRETGAFHEAFGDCSAMLMSLQDVAHNERLIAQTGGDMTKPNATAWLAEEFGKARRLSNDDPSDDDRAWLRNAQNSFTYVPPESLGDGRGDDETLGGEIHSFARLFAGAFYDCLNAAYQNGLNEQSLPPAQALKFAADTLGPIFARAVDRAPSNRGRFKDIGMEMIHADQEINQGKLSEQIKKVFLDRKIITPDDFEGQGLRRSATPELRVDHNFTSGQEAAAYVSARAQQLGLPEGVRLDNVAVSLNAEGEQVVNALYAQQVPVTVPGLEGLKTDISAGITLSFDPQGRLSDYRHNAINEDTLKDEMDGIAYLQRKGLILEDQRGPMVYTREDGKAYQAVIRGDQLIRVPSSSCDCGSCAQCNSSAH